MKSARALPALSVIAMAILSSATVSAQPSTGAPPATTPQTFSQTALDWVRLRYSSTLNREPYGWSLKQVERQFEVVFDAARIAGHEGISVHDEKLAEDIQRARARANAIRQVLEADINGDGKVTREEVRIMLRQRYSYQTTQHREARMQREFDRIFRNDRDRDGTITMDEIRQSADMQSLLNYSSGYRSSDKSVPMSLDRNGDGVLMRDEFLDAVRIVYAEIDRDKDGYLSETEFRAFMLTMRDVRRREAQARRETYAATRIARQISRCNFPKLPDNTRLAFAATYRGQALANISFKNSQSLLTLTQIDIEPGDDMLTLVLSAPGNMVWQVTGATGRVAKVLVGSNFAIGKQSSIAISGVAAEKVHFIETSSCLPTSFRSDTEKQQIVRTLRALTGAGTTAAVSISLGRKISLPSGKLDGAAANPAAIAPPKDSPGSVFWQAAMQTFPAGIVRLGEKSIVSQMPVAASAVLPGRAGLAQLIDQGALELSQTQPAASPPSAVRLPVAELRIVAPIHMPTGLSPRIVRKFVLAKDVKAPDGLRSQVCVVGEADGKPVAGSASC